MVAQGATRAPLDAGPVITDRFWEGHIGNSEVETTVWKRGILKSLLADLGLRIERPRNGRRRGVKLYSRRLLSTY